MSNQKKEPEKETNQDPLADLIQPKATPPQPKEVDDMAAMEQALLQPPADSSLFDPETLAALSDLAEMEASLLLNPLQAARGEPETAVSDPTSEPVSTDDKPARDRLANPKPDWLDDSPFDLDDGTLPEDEGLLELLDQATDALLAGQADDIFIAADLAEEAETPVEAVEDEDEPEETAVFDPAPDERDKDDEDTLAETAIFADDDDALMALWADEAELEETAVFDSMPDGDEDEALVALLAEEAEPEETAVFAADSDDEDDALAALLADADALQETAVFAADSNDEANALAALAETMSSADEDDALLALQETLADAATAEPAPRLFADESDALAALQEPAADFSDDEAAALAALQPAADYLQDIISTIDDEVEAAYGNGTITDLSSEQLTAPLQSLRQYVVFMLAGEMYAAPANHVREVAQLTAVTRIPNVPGWLMGVTNLRGDVLSLIGLRAFLGLSSNGHSEQSFSHGDSQVMVVHSEKHASSITTGLVVDEIEDIRYLDTDQIGVLSAPIEDQVAPYLQGVYEENGRLLVLLDLEKLLLSPAIWQFDLT
ncbi:MAG: chemotaxis protein CheW [Anaerolineales bacterium]|nr:chemotaxis protein CheW [Anaerolineales bacterium]MCB9430796.1 chemotaxis protein CheW [Ardenticatenaceae bacterium]